MKKFLLSMFALVASLTGLAQENSIVIENKEGFQFSRAKRLSLMVKKDLDSNVKIQLSNGNYWKHTATWYDGKGEWQKLVFDFTASGIADIPTQIAIYPTTDEVDEEQDIYIDNIVLEDAPMVNGVLLSQIADGSLSGSLTLTGSWMKGRCMNTDTNPWTEVVYDDFAMLNAKLSDKVTSVDMRGTVTKDVQIVRLFENPNTIVYADEPYGHANVVVDGHSSDVLLDDSYAFAVPEAFLADGVTLKRGMRNGVNSFVLPFDVAASELGAGYVATYSGMQDGSGKYVMFDKSESVAGNIPFLAVDAEAASSLSFDGKTFMQTPSAFDGVFNGVYAPQSADGLYGIDNNGKLHRGGSKSSIASFHAYLSGAVGQSAAMVAFSGATTDVDKPVDVTMDSADTPVYDLCGREVGTYSNWRQLAKGIYIIGGKKMSNY